MMTEIQETDAILQASKASEEFKNAVMELQAGRNAGLINFNSGAPPVKILRVISKLLEMEPGLKVESVNIQAESGCSDFVGSVDVNGGEKRFEFVWDCNWRAKEEGYTDHFGYPDQIRAAREFGYQCFKKFEPAA